MSTWVATIGPRPLVTLAVVGLLLVGGWRQGQCEEPARAYRRLLVPADRPESWPRDGTSLLPVEAAEFQDWIRAANEPPSSASIVEAEYHGRFDGDNLTKTHGWWRVERQGRRTTRIPLSATGVELVGARWQKNGALPARLGWWPNSRGDGFERGLEVPAEGVLEFNWRAPQLAEAGDWVFQLDLPVATQTRLILDLPAATRPIVNGSRVLSDPGSSKNGGRWALALAPRHRHELTIEEISTKRSVWNAPSLRESGHYTIRRTGIELEATLELDGRGALPPSLDVHMPAGMALVSVECAGAALPWKLSAGNMERADVATIEFGGADRPRPTSVVIRAWAPFDANKPMRFSLVAVDDLFWTAGEITLAIDEALEPVEIDADGALQTAASGSDLVEQGIRSLRFTAYAPAAALNATFRHRHPAGQVETGATLAFRGAEISSGIVSRIGISHGRTHQLAAQIDHAFMIDAVDSIPSELLSDWYVDRSSDPPELRLRLQRAIAPGERVDIVVTGRTPTSADKSISSSDLIPVRWQHLQSTTELVQLVPGDLYDLVVDGPLDERGVKELPAELQSLIEPVDGARVAMLHENERGLVRLTPKKVAYDATVEIDASFRAARGDVAYELVCSPRGGGIDHVLVFCSEPTAERIHWIESASGHPLNIERLPTSDPRVGGMPDGGELWRLEFGRLYARPITIAAKISIDADPGTKVPLISLPDAAMQQGRVTVRAYQGQNHSVIAKNMAPAPVPVAAERPPSSVEEADVSAVYRFQPARFYDSAEAPELAIEPATNDTLARPIAKRIDVESRYSVDGTGVHRATLHFDNTAVSQLALRFPKNFIVTGVRVDGTPIGTKQSNRIELRLPLRSIVIVEFDCLSRGRRLVNGGQLESPLPVGSFALVAGEWKVSLPNGFEAVDDAIQSEWGWCVRLFGPLARRSGSPFNPLDPGDWNLLWARMNDFTTSPALAAEAELSPLSDSMPNGMEARRFAFGTAPPPRLTLIHRRATTAMGFAVFVFSLVGSQIIRCRLRTKLWLAMAASATSLLLPVAWVPLATAATLGFAAAVIWQWIQPGLQPRATTAAIVVIVSMILGVCHPSHAQSSIERVLVPVNEDGKPVGTKYFVATDFLQDLLAAANSAALDTGWLLTRLQCDGQLVELTEGAANIDTGSWRLTLDLDLAARDTDIVLPLVREQAVWQAHASWDGIPLPIRWSGDGQSCSIRVAEPGRGQLTIGFVPHTKRAGVERSLELKLPAVHGTVIRVQGPRGLSGLQSANTPFELQNTNDGSVWQGELGAGGQLSLTWPVEINIQIGETNRQVAELQKLTVGSSRMISELHLSQLNQVEWPATVMIAADPSWQFVSDRRLVAEVSPETPPDGRTLYAVQLTPQLRSEPRLQFQFASIEGQPWGRIRPPSIELIAPKPTERWLAVVSNDPQIECEPATLVGTSDSLPPSLAAALDGAEIPRAVVDLKRVDPDWYLSVRPARQQSTSRDRLSIAIGKDRVRVSYRVEVTPQAADRFGQSLVVPANFSVREITVVKSEERVPIHWVRTDRKQVQVFFDRPAVHTYLLELLGDLPLPADGVLAVPRIGRSQGQDANQIVALYRDEGVSAEWQFANEPPWIESGASLSPPFDEHTRFVRAYALDSATAPSVRVVVDRNEPQLTGATLTRVFRGKSGWGANWKCDMQVEQGAVDVLRLEAPVEWEGPFDVSEGATLQAMAPVAGSPVREILISLPHQAKIGDKLRLRVQSLLATTEGQAVSAPRVLVLADGIRQDFVSVPTRSNGEQITWTRSGVEPAELPAVLSRDETTAADQTTLKVTGEAMNVVLRSQPPRADRSNIRLTETSILLGDARQRLDVTRFYLAPGGLGGCELRIPAGQRLVRASVAGRPASVRLLTPNRFELQFHHPRLPQTIDIVTESTVDDDATLERIEMNPPVLENAGRVMSVDLVLWSIKGDFSRFTQQPIGCAAVSPADLAKLRLDWMTSISLQASGALLEAPPVDGYHWLTGWARELLEVRLRAEEAEQDLTNASAATRVAHPERDKDEDSHTQSLAWVEQMAELFDVAFGSLAAERTGAQAELEPAKLAVDAPGDLACFVSEGNHSPLFVQLTTATWTANRTRYFLLGTLGALAIASAWLVRSPQRLARFEGRPEVWALALGLAAWLWLQPSLAGLAIAIGAAVLLVRRICREKKSPRHDSSKLPSSIPEDLA